MVVALHRVSPHLEQGFPGNLDQIIRYTLTENNELIWDYEMKSDMTTVVNPTNHSYFNLSGHDSGDVLSHELEVFSDSYRVKNDELVEFPYGYHTTVSTSKQDTDLFQIIQSVY